MTSITAMKKRLDQLDAEKAAILARVSTTSRKNSDARKYALGGALLKLAEADKSAHDTLKMALVIAQKYKPKAFEDFKISGVSNRNESAK